MFLFLSKARFYNFKNTKKYFFFVKVMKLSIYIHYKVDNAIKKYNKLQCNSEELV